ncbi:MAG TPA: ketopantoate reductase family protein [Euzebyales bacterium]
MRVAVYGAGGIGAYFGGRLAAAGVDVALIARGAHLRALQADGLHVRSPKGDIDVALTATDDPADIGAVDVVLFTVKSQDTTDAARRLGPLLEHDTAVVSLQNGVGNEEAIAAEIGSHHTLGGVVYLLSTISEPGTVVHSAGPATLIFGELDGERTERAARLFDALRTAGVDATLSSDVRQAIWDKFAFICALSGMTAAVRLPIGAIRSEPASWRMFRDVLREVAAVAAAEGIELSDEAIARHESFAQGLEPGTHSSLHYDMTHGKPMELDALHGELLRRAEAHGVAVPATRAIVAILQPWAARNAAASDA